MIKTTDPNDTSLILEENVSDAWIYRWSVHIERDGKTIFRAFSDVPWTIPDDVTREELAQAIVDLVDGQSEQRVLEARYTVDFDERARRQALERAS